MWKIFFKDNTSAERCLLSIDFIKQEIFTQLEDEVRAYFAEKIVLYFDNNMLFQQKRGLHVNLIDALQDAEQDVIKLNGVFPRVELYWMKEEENNTLLTFGLKDKFDKYFIQQGFELIKKDAVPSKSLIVMEFNAWKTILFDIAIVDYISSWIKYAPSLERRAMMQTEYILLSTHLKNNDLSTTEIIAFEENLKKHNSYNNLYEKIMRVMPKIENSLYEEWSSNEKGITKELRQKRKF